MREKEVSETSFGSEWMSCIYLFAESGSESFMRANANGCLCFLQFLNLSSNIAMQLLYKICWLK